MAESKRCPNCGLELPANAAQSFCPACLLRQGMESHSLSVSHPGEPGVTVHWSERISHRSVLDVLKSAIGEVPSVLLRDTDAGPDAPVVRPSSPEMPAERGRYQLLGEIGHGGMGAVFKGRDPDLGRDLAVKVLREEYHDDPEMARRFVEEAQIGGQLQHPGIVPVYELGSFGDRRPYFTMKLVKGRTLAALLKERAGPAHDLTRFLGIFEQVCQTMAYAHARGVIHRDLKPSNIMVGSFGEVQVMDWGLAKVLPQGGTADEARPDPDEAAMGVVRTVRSGSDADASQPGSAVGTPAYMAPEQAAGDIKAIDERSDVFGLGSILCEILTGQPAYTGHSSDAIQRRAMRGETADALRRLDGSGADAELVAVARDCLAADPEQRPREAGEVALRMTAYFAGVQERLRAAELARAAEEARAEEATATAAAAEGRARAERQSRRMTVGMAASVLVAGLLGAAGWTWVERDRVARINARSAQVNTALQEATGLRGQAQGTAVGDLIAWTKALAAAQKARDLLEPGLDRALRRQVENLLAAITSEKERAETAARAADSDRLLLDKLVDIRSARTDDPDGSIRDRDYAEAFREAGIDVTALPLEQTAARIKARPASVAAALVAALDDWAAVRRSLRRDGPGALRLAEAANAADPDPWRAGLRRALDLADRASQAKALRDLAASTKPETAPAVTLNLLGTALSEVGEAKAAEGVLRAGRRRFPDDVWLNFDLARVLEMQSRGEEAIRYYSIARALRPETGHELAHVLDGKGESVEATAVFRDLVRRRPDAGRHLACYGGLLRDTGNRSGSREALERAVAVLRRRIQLKPDDSSAHNDLANALLDQEKLEEAIAEYGEAIRTRPDFAGHHHGLGNALLAQKKFEEAIAEYKTAIRLQPDFAYAHMGLGTALNHQGKREEAIAEFREAIRLKPDYAMAHDNFGNALKDQGKLDEAIVEYREGIRLKPDAALAHYNLGIALHNRGKPDEAIAEFREAIPLKPDFADSHVGLGNVLRYCGKWEEAIAEYREAIRIKPDNASAHNGLGNALRDQGKREEAIAEYREAIRIKADESTAHVNLGDALGEQGKLEEAIAEFREAIRLNPDDALGHHGLGNALLAQKKLEEAIAEYKTAIRLQPDFAYARMGLGTALNHQGKREEAIAEFREAIRLKPDDATPHGGLGVALMAQGKQDEGIAEYRESIRLKPDYVDSHIGLVNALHKQGKLAEAIAEIREVIRIKPDDASPHYNLGIVLSEVGKREEAIGEFREAIRLKPDYAMAHNNLGYALQDQGKLDEAIAECKTAVRLKPDAAGYNNVAWALVLFPNRPRRDYDEGLVYARKTVELAPKDGNSFNTLALAEYRSGHWAESLAAGERSMEMRKGGDAADWFFQAMARWQKGDKDEARTWFDKAVAWTREKDPKNVKLRQFWTEAADLLGQPGPTASAAGSPAAPAADKPQ